jgi:hypothetical protein
MGSMVIGNISVFLEENPQQDHRIPVRSLIGPI